MVKTLGWYVVIYLQAAYIGLVVLLHLEWQYLYISVPGVGVFVGPLEKDLVEKILPKLLG